MKIQVGNPPPPGDLSKKILWSPSLLFRAPRSHDGRAARAGDGERMREKLGGGGGLGGGVARRGASQPPRRPQLLLVRAPLAIEFAVGRAGPGPRATSPHAFSSSPRKRTRHVNRCWWWRWFRSFPRNFPRTTAKTACATASDDQTQRTHARCAHSFSVKIVHYTWWLWNMYQCSPYGPNLLFWDGKRRRDQSVVVFFCRYCSPRMEEKSFRQSGARDCNKSVQFCRMGACTLKAMCWGGRMEDRTFGDGNDAGDFKIWDATLQKQTSKPKVTRQEHNFEIENPAKTRDTHKFQKQKQSLFLIPFALPSGYPPLIW